MNKSTSLELAAPAGRAVSPQDARGRHLILEDRSRLSVSGVLGVERFDEREAVVTTDQGTLLVRGTELHMEKMSLESGEIVLCGSVDSMEYEELRREGFFARLLR